MVRRALPFILAVNALAFDLSADHGVALVFVLCAIPAAFGLALECYGDALEARCGGLRPLLAGLGLVLLVLSAALRSPAVVGGTPQLAVSAIVLCLFFYAAAFAGALLAPRPAKTRLPAEEPEPERLAA